MPREKVKITQDKAVMTSGGEIGFILLIIPIVWVFSYLIFY